MPTPSLLAIDTASRRAEIALRVGENKFAAAAELGLSHELVLDKLLQQVLNSAGIPLSQVASLIIGAGPGSFTGLRIGYAFASGLALAAVLKVTSASSLQARAQIVLEKQAGVVVSLSDARRSEVFCGIYARKLGEEVKCLSEDAIIGVSDLGNFVKRMTTGEFLEMQPQVICDSQLEYQFEDHLRPSIFAGEYNAALGLLDCSLTQKWALNPIQLAELAPNYLRKVAAKSISERKLNNAS